MKVLGLFSGIGGFELGLERAGMEIVGMCEIEPYCRAVLRKHWPDVPIYEDVRELTGEGLKADGIVPDLICGGFPCQDISEAGNRGGIRGEKSGLWSEVIRLSGEIRPQYIIVENVSALLWRGIEDVLGDLAQIGFDSEWHCIPASAVGAPHLRDRIWIIAYPQGKPGLHESNAWQVAQRLFGDPSPWHANPWNEAIPWVCRVDDGVPDRVDRTSALGNAVVPQIPEMIGRAILEAA